MVQREKKSPTAPISGIGEKIRTLRKQRGLKQKDVALVVGVTAGSVTQWETDVTNPSLQALNALCEFFKVDMNFFSNQNQSTVAPFTVQKPEPEEDTQIKLSDAEQSPKHVSTSTSQMYSEEYVKNLEMELERERARNRTLVELNDKFFELLGKQWGEPNLQQIGHYTNMLHQVYRNNNLGNTQVAS